MAKSSKSVSKKQTTATTPKISKKKSLIAKSAKKSSKPKSAFTKEVHLFRDQKDCYSLDRKYDAW
jgi:hypothetical protein